MFILAPLSIRPDAAGPALLVGLGVIAALALGVILLVEALILWRLGWANFWRSLAGALVANIASSAVGLIFVVFQPPSVIVFLVLSFVASVVVEAGVLMLFKRNAVAENWRASLIINVISYVLVGLLLALAGGV
ncbi:MAG TPA: hypothetical protein VNK95_25035 [Caldilineaceae bacterium]|nr:hypothetical protein [Caldilineaceae bacterium]